MFGWFALQAAMRHRKRRRRRFTTEELVERTAAGISASREAPASRNGDAISEGYVFGFSQAILGGYGYAGILESMRATAMVFEQVYGPGAGKRVPDALHRVRAGEIEVIADRLRGTDDATRLLETGDL